MVELLLAIEAWRQLHGVPPSERELARWLRICHTAVRLRILKARKLGFIRQQPPGAVRHLHLTDAGRAATEAARPTTTIHYLVS